ncbi:hypothetical protein VIGAN_01289500 [Vigna angularis var. angularis]|uniref:Uncharacterized protein n=1 Tax=Vigna angularis var. angularis TaxID=157739 RepID=A0A0S3R3G1_PHAAN|nr:hypothetical protein VIGAN_01289500 [Vigna angularis var. angularis]
MIIQLIPEIKETAKSVTQCDHLRVPVKRIEFYLYEKLIKSKTKGKNLEKVASVTHYPSTLSTVCHPMHIFSSLQNFSLYRESLKKKKKERGKGGRTENKLGSFSSILQITF